MESCGTPERAQASAAAETDTDLLERYRLGNSDAATLIYQRYAGRLRAVLESRWDRELKSRLDADDILQSAFCSFFRRAAEGDYHVPPGDELWTLLVSIAINKLHSAQDYHRALKRDVSATTSTEALEEGIPFPRAPDARASVELRWLIGELIHPLPAVQQRIIQLRLDGHEVAEIARRTTRSKRTVERVLQSFRKALQARLDPAAP